MAPHPLTAKEIEILAAAFPSHRNPWDLDFNKLAEYGGYKNAKSLNACFAPVKKKIQIWLNGQQTGAVKTDEGDGQDVGEKAEKAKKRKATTSAANEGKDLKAGKRARTEDVSEEGDDGEANGGWKLMQEPAEDGAKVKWEEDA